MEGQEKALGLEDTATAEGFPRDTTTRVTAALPLSWDGEHVPGCTGSPKHPLSSRHVSEDSLRLPTAPRSRRSSRAKGTLPSTRLLRQRPRRVLRQQGGGHSPTRAGRPSVGRPRLRPPAHVVDSHVKTSDLQP